MHPENPASLIEAAFARIHRERMAGLGMLNPALAVAAVGFERRGNDWRGVLVTPWGINLLLLPAVADWPMPDSHQRAFREYASGTFAFLGNREEDLGPYLSCPLIHDMAQFADQESALLTARACLIALDRAPNEAPVDASAPASPSRRSFLLRKVTA